MGACLRVLFAVVLLQGCVQQQNVRSGDGPGAATKETAINESKPEPGKVPQTGSAAASKSTDATTRYQDADTSLVRQPTLPEPSSPSPAKPTAAPTLKASPPQRPIMAQRPPSATDTAKKEPVAKSTLAQAADPETRPSTPKQPPPWQAKPTPAPTLKASPPQRPITAQRPPPATDTTKKEPVAKSTAPPTRKASSPQQSITAKRSPPATNTTTTNDKAAAESQLALAADPKVMLPKSTAAEEISIPTISLEKLPVALNEYWTLDWSRDPVSKQDRCHLRSARKRIQDGQGESDITLYLTQDSLRVATRSNVDISYEGDGLEIDAKKQFLLEGLFGENEVLFKTQMPDIHQQLQGSTSLKITLGFWPTWPVTQTHSTQFQTRGYASAHAALVACDKQVP